jgi:hypothetical protein
MWLEEPWERIWASASIGDIALRNWWWLAEPRLQADLTGGALKLQTGLLVARPRLGAGTAL